MTRSMLAVLCALLSFTVALSAQEAARDTSLDTAPLDERIGALVQQYHDLGQFSGTALVADGGKVIYTGAFGNANEDWAIPNGVDTKFRLASVTKQFTAMLVLLLVERGQLELEAPIIRYLPSYPAEAGHKVTVHHLLNHTSGIPSYTSRPGFMQKDSLNRYSVEEFVVKYCSDPLQFEPGTEFRYNNSGYYLLGAIVEAVTGETYATALQEHIFDPLGMQDSGYDDQNAVISKRAMGYDELLGERRLSRWIDMSNPYAAGALYSTVGDLWKWDQALRSKRLLRGRLEERMFTPGLGNYGYGWGVDVRDPDRVVTRHSGGINGFSTVIFRVASRGRCIVLLSNQSGSANGDLSRGISAILDGETPREPRPRPAESLAKTILSDGIDPALARLSEFPRDVRFGRLEGAVNSLGYQLIERGRVQEAVKVLEFNTRAYPTSANVWDSLGEAHMIAGDRELAIENYRKALELDPGSTTAPAMLKKLDESRATAPAEGAIPKVDSYFQGHEVVESQHGPNQITRAVGEDAEGNIWLASWEGITRYDGSSFLNLTNRDGLARFRGFCVLRDRSDAVWIGTIGAGVYRYDGRSFTHFTAQDGLVGNKVLSIVQDKAGGIWFGTTEGASRFDGRSFQNLTTADGLTHNEVTTLIEDRSGKLWFGTRGSACVYDGEEFVTLETIPGSPFTNVRSIIEDSDGAIWLGGNDGLWRYELSGAGLQELPVPSKHLPNFCGYLYEDRGGNLWASASDPENMYEMTLVRFDGKPSVVSPEPTRIAAPRGQVFGIHEDGDGKIWFGTEKGVSVYDGESVRGFRD